jgi:hypothetical protein
MLASYRRKANIAAAIFFAGLILFFVYMEKDGGNIWKSGDILQTALAATWVISFYYCFWAFAKAKGYSGWLGLVLPIFIVGPIILLLLKDKHKSGLAGSTAPTSVSTQAQLSGMLPASIEDKRRPMNKQKVVLMAAAGLALLAILFPPFTIHHPVSGAAYNAGFSFLFSDSGAVVNTGLLALELAVVAIVGAIAWILAKD